METATLDPPVETDPTPMPHDPPADGTGDPNAPDPPGADDPTTVEPEPTTPQAEQEPVAGDEGYLTTDAGGKTPTDSKLQILGTTLHVEGQIQKGAVIRGTIELRVGGLHFDDKEDGATGQVIASTRKHRAKIIGFARQS